MATFRGKPMLSWTSQGQPELPRKSWWKSCWNHPKFGSSSYPLDVWTHPNFESWNITQLYFRWCFWMFPAINLHCVGLFCRFPWNPQPPAPSLGVSSSLGTRDPRVGQTGDRNYKIFRTFNVMFNVIFNTIVTIQMIQNDSIWFNLFPQRHGELTDVDRFIHVFLNFRSVNGTSAISWFPDDQTWCFPRSSILMPVMLVVGHLFTIISPRPPR